MAQDKFNTYSSKGIDVGSTGLKYGVTEMTEGAVSYHLQDGKRSIVTGITSDIESDFMKDIVSDGVNAGLGYFSAQAMQLQETLLEGAFNQGTKVVLGWYAGSYVKDKFKKYAKGRKAMMFSKFLSGSDKKAEEARLIADFVKMDIDSSANTHSPTARQKQYEAKYIHENLEVSKENVRARLATLNISGMRETFDMKLKTSSFTNIDKKLIQQMTGKRNIDKEDINKLNAMSNAQVFQDSDGNWVGGNEAMVILMNGLGLHRA